MPDVTVIMPVYNGKRYLDEAVASVFSQTYQDWTLLFVNDGSTDGTATLLRRYLFEPRVRILTLSRNVGQGTALNHGLEHVHTPFFVQLDADDWFEPGTIEVLRAELLRQPPDISLAYGNMALWFEADGELTSDRVIVRKARDFADRYELLEYGPTVCPRFYRTSSVRQAGGWPIDDPFGGRYMEDKLLLTRLAEFSRFTWVDDLLYNHRRHAANQTDRYRSRYNALIKWLVQRRLREWGAAARGVQAQFSMNEGWVMVELRGTEKGP